jgi:hypothetical protein
MFYTENIHLSTDFLSRFTVGFKLYIKTLAFSLQPSASSHQPPHGRPQIPHVATSQHSTDISLQHPANSHQTADITIHHPANSQHNADNMKTPPLSNSQHIADINTQHPANSQHIADNMKTPPLSNSQHNAGISSRRISANCQTEHSKHQFSALSHQP